MPGLQIAPLNDTTLSDFEEMTKNAAQVQEAVLKTILERNAEAEYLQMWGLSGQIDLNSFKSRVPLVTHSDLQPYIQRIVDDDKSCILTVASIEMLSLSSGTTNGQQKYLPFYKEIMKATLEVARIAAAFRASVYPVTPGARIMELIFCGKQFSTKGGLKAGTATTHLLKSDTFKMRQRDIRVKACSPHEVVFGTDCRQAMYCHLLCGLLFSEEMEFLSSTFSYTIVEAFRTFELEWQNLCEDIRVGKLTDRISDAATRVAVSKILRPNAELASVITRKCRGLLLNDWYSVVPEIWPRCKYVHSIMTGAMEPYLRKLQHYAGKLPLVCADYGATEGWIAVNVNPRSPPANVFYTIVPSLAFFEFIPLYRSTSSSLSSFNASASATAYDEADPVGLTEVKVGQEYEIVMTTYGGLYRYRLGDVVRITGFFNSSPQFTYVCRKNVVLSVNIDKNTEKDLRIVVSKAAKRLAEATLNALEVVDYTSYADLQTTPGHYVIFWELGDKGERVQQQQNQQHNNIMTQICTLQKQKLKDEEEEERVLAECATLMDRTFVEPGYIMSRKMNSIGALELCVVRPGTFASLLDGYMAKGPSMMQYKTPSCIFSPNLIAILRGRTCSTHFSTAILA